MNIALRLQSRVVAVLHGLFQTEPVSPVSFHSAPPTRIPHQRHTQGLQAQAVNSAPRQSLAVGPAMSPRKSLSRCTTARALPLRVVHVLEAGQPLAKAGRMVISGRMADVCAELNRLVERETALN